MAAAGRMAAVRRAGEGKARRRGARPGAVDSGGGGGGELRREYFLFFLLIFGCNFFYNFFSQTSFS